MANAKQAIAIVGESTKNLYKFVRWEIELAKSKGLPIVVVNLNGTRKLDSERCPVPLRAGGAVHVSFNTKIIQHALDYFPGYIAAQAMPDEWYYYNENTYSQLGL
jgi:hypothetical protein